MSDDVVRRVLERLETMARGVEASQLDAQVLDALPTAQVMQLYAASARNLAQALRDLASSDPEAAGLWAIELDQAFNEAGDEDAP